MKKIKNKNNKDLEFIDLDEMDPEDVEGFEDDYDDYDDLEDDYDDSEDDYDDSPEDEYYDGDDFEDEECDPEDDYRDDVKYSEDSEEYDEEYDEDYDDDYDEYYEDEYDDDDYDDRENVEYYEDESGIKTTFNKIADFFASRTVTDYIIAGVAAAAVIVLVFLGVFLLGNKTGSGAPIAELADLGSNMDSIDIIGNDGLIAMSDSMAAKKLAAEMEEQLLLEEEEEEELSDTDENGEKVIIMNLVSIQKDLKIKIVNSTSGKLVTGTAFEVAITDPSGKKSTQTDSDKDGIIYLSGISAGTYKVSLQGPEGEYTFSKDNVSIKVKDTIEYKKVDVADEIKSEKDVNAAAEDTEKKAEVESTLTDTVEYVESTKTEISGTGSYVEVSKSDIADPGSTSSIKSNKKYAPKYIDVADNEDGSEEATATPTEEPASDPTATPTEEATSTPTSEPTSEATATATPTSVATATATPTVTPTASSSASTSPTPTATPSAAGDTSSTLKTTSGDTLYVKDGDGYREAKYADYYKDGITFYKHTGGSYKYTGWQTIDGYTYYFDKDGNYVTGDQIIQGAQYSFDSSGRLNTGSGVLGIDVSKWNGTIDWSAVKSSGVSYVIIRCGYRGSSSGALIQDPMFKTNIKGALNAGLKVGVYFFSQATTEVEAVEEASMTLSLISGYNISFPVFLDVEASGGRGDSISADTRTKVCKAFCQTIQNSGYKAGIYANRTWLNSNINTGELTSYKIWLAQYAATPTYTRTRYDMWQYSSKGSVSGISGNVDMNISYLGY